MGCGGMYFPTNLGVRISELRPGDEIIILKGEGYPAVAQETTTIVWILAGFSALCIDGTAISCLNVSDFIRTGRHFDRFEISEEAKQMEKEASERRREMEAEEAELLAELELDHVDPTIKFKGLDIPNPPPEPE
ncbi:MAG: hypothetical protein ACD_61C00229G0001 [uncultured bacterium]|nr:MAG: hypothetical protein ACD_61C00229G0001 [uncultured bacterium]